MATEIRGERGPELVIPTRAGTVIRINDASTRTDIAAAIAALKAKHDRLPVHYREDRHEIMDEIDALIDRWLAARA